MFKKARPDWRYLSFIGGILTGIAFVGLFVRMPPWVGYGTLAELLYAILIAVFATAGARSGVWLYDRTILRPERERHTIQIKAVQAQQERTRKAAEFAEQVKRSQQAAADAAEIHDLRARCSGYETEIRVLRAELARRAPHASTLLCD